MEETTQLPDKQKQETKVPNKKLMLYVGVGLIVLLLAGSAYLGWLWWTANDDKAKLQTANKELQTQVEQLKAKLADDATTESDSKDETAKPCDSTVGAGLKANIQDAVKSKNLAALQGYMASSVTVIIAASEGVGARTPAQAVVDMEYLNGATAPWDFNLSPATIANYQAGFYVSYFGANTFVGRAANPNDMVVSFDFDDCAKIKTVFMAVSEDLLQP